MSSPALSKHQSFVMERMARSAIVEHPSNPRIIKEEARKKLKAKMKDVGLMQPIIVNKTTGYLLGGHQRLASLDALERYKPGTNDYSLDVAVVQVDVKTELEMLVFLNNPSSQGTWNLEGLADMALSDLAGGVTLEGMGFDKVDVEMMFDGDARFGGLFGDDLKTKEGKDKLKDIKQEGLDEAKRKRAEDKEGGGKSGLDQFREKGAKDVSSDFYVVVVCKDQAEKEALMKHLHLPKGEQYIAPHEIMTLKRG